VTASQSYLADNFVWVKYWYSIAIVSWPASLPMFLFGLYVVARSGHDSHGRAGRNAKIEKLATTSFVTAEIKVVARFDDCFRDLLSERRAVFVNRFDQCFVVL
jgi:hypothetical protein